LPFHRYSGILLRFHHHRARRGSKSPDPRRQKTWIMKLSELIEAGTVVVPLPPGDKWETIRTLAQRLVERKKVPLEKSEEMKLSLFARERSMSTGMEHGVAIPHAAIDGVPSVSACLGISVPGIPFDSIDGKPAQIVVCLVIPRQQKLLHIRTLAEIARLLSRESIRQRILACSTGESILEVIREEEKPARSA
jgi:mannitol/fructose-specific phosphotransferase system IIA component (Ntr-type)